MARVSKIRPIWLIQFSASVGSAFPEKVGEFNCLKFFRAEVALPSGVLSRGCEDHLQPFGKPPQ